MYLKTEDLYHIKDLIEKNKKNAALMKDALQVYKEASTHGELELALAAFDTILKFFNNSVENLTMIITLFMDATDYWGQCEREGLL